MPVCPGQHAQGAPGADPPWVSRGFLFPQISSRPRGFPLSQRAFPAEVRLLLAPGSPSVPSSAGSSGLARISPVHPLILTPGPCGPHSLWGSWGLAHVPGAPAPAPSALGSISGPVRLPRLPSGHFPGGWEGRAQRGALLCAHVCRCVSQGPPLAWTPPPPLPTARLSSGRPRLTSHLALLPARG